jgi:hypothetical protein
LSHRVTCRLLFLLALTLSSASLAATPGATDADALRERYAQLAPLLDGSPFDVPLLLESSEAGNLLQGDVHAVVAHGFEEVRTALTSPASWCATLILHLNVKYCRPSQTDTGTTLHLAMGRKIYQPPSATHRVLFNFSVPDSRDDLVSIRLEAATGPFGTSGYEVALDAIPVDAQHTFLHLRYRYRYGFWARLGTRLYLAGAGHTKIGFSRVDAPADPIPRYIGGFRGILERNILRYYLAIDARLDTLALPEDEQFERSIETWFASTERYAAQLHEMEHDEYISVKRAEHLRPPP